MKKPAFEGRANSVATKTILAPSCLVVDAALPLFLAPQKSFDRENKLLFK